jgi:hypothetical protein
VRSELTILCVALSAAIPAGAANACRVPYRPVEPLYQHFDAAALATVLSSEGSSTTVGLDRFIRGSADRKRIQLSFEHPPGSCGPGGPRVQIGEKLVIYFAGQQARRWDRQTDLISRDPYVEAALAEVTPAKRKRLLRRAAEVMKFKGPVPVTNPALWAAPHAGDLGWTASSGNITRARFQVLNDGTLSDCRVFLASKPADRDNLVCHSLKLQRRFKAPLLSQERKGMYEVRWDEFVSTKG